MSHASVAVRARWTLTRARGALALAAIAGLASVAGCSVGEGTGEITGAVFAPDCNLELTDYSLEPSFYAGEVTGPQLDLRIQRGSDIEGYGDGLMIHVRDVNEVKTNRIGLPIPVDASASSLVQVVVYLNETCKSGFPDEFLRQPLILEAVAGTVRFDAVYAPDLDSGQAGIAAELVGVRFEDRDRPAERNVTLDGWFSFFYQRGGPAQRFP